MRYALRNLVRLKARSLLTFVIAFSVLLLSMMGAIIFSFCEDNRALFYGPLDGAYHVTNEEGTPYLTYEAAQVIAEDAEVVTSLSAVKTYDGILTDVRALGNEKGEYIEGFRIVGVTSMEILSEVFGGDLTMTQGTMITVQNNEAHHNKIVISEELAEANGLTIGDTVTLSMPSLYRTEAEQHGYIPSTPRKDAYVYIIGGIYRNRLDNTSVAAAPWEQNANRVYVPITTLTDISHDAWVRELYHMTTREAGGKVFDIEYALKESPDVIPEALYFHISQKSAVGALSDEINELGFSDVVLLTEYVSDATSSPSARLSEIVSAVLIGVITVGFVIFLLAILFNIKARHRELAMLTALGKKRNAVANTFFAEIAVLTSLALLVGGLLLSLGVSFLAEPITSYLYAAELHANLTNESSDFFFLEHHVGSPVTERTADFGLLFTNYILPSVLFALIAGVALMVLLYFFIRIYVARINPLSDVGGKENAL
ncbi:MAG: ABC transporter permease [Clostridia bacterium]|nr:ABC transporter permease [Clostridia bacterium]